MASKEEIHSKQDKAMEGLSDAAKVIQDAADSLVRFSKSAGLEAKEEIEYGVKKSAGFIKKHPLESALLCFGAGVVAGLILKSRD